jgi:intracellular sulfur oxidation DsrE/DsrF family protein
MRTHPLLSIATLFATLFAAAAFFSTHAQADSLTAQSPEFWSTPTIHHYGKIHFLPNGHFKPQPGQTYKIVFNLTQAAAKPDEVNPSLDHVARTVNLYVAAGVPLRHLKFVAVASGPATPLALNDVQYRAAYGISNPNLPLIAELKKAGITVAVCGQAVAEHHFQYGWINPDVVLSLSALTTVTTLEQKGYALMPL